MMKKAIFISLFVVLAVGISYAVKDLTLTTSKLERVEINFAYDTHGKWDADLLSYGDIIDGEGAFVKTMKQVHNRSDLPAEIMSDLDNVLKYLSKEFNKSAADEDKETLKETQKQEGK